MSTRLLYWLTAGAFTIAVCGTIYTKKVTIVDAVTLPAVAIMLAILTKRKAWK